MGTPNSIPSTGQCCANNEQMFFASPPAGSGPPPSNPPVPYLELAITPFYTGGRVLLSGNADGTGNILVYDEILVTVVHTDFSTSTLTHEFNPGCTGLTSAPPLDISSVFAPGDNQFWYIQLLTSCGSTGWSDIWLVTDSCLIFSTALASPAETHPLSGGAFRVKARPRLAPSTLRTRDFPRPPGYPRAPPCAFGAQSLILHACPTSTSASP